jgi:hypothetical protein
MGTPKSHLTAAIQALVLASLAMTYPACARTIVIQASGPSAAHFPSGRLLAEPLSLDLRTGDVVTVLDGAGTRILNGPATIRDATARAVPADTRLAIAALLLAKPQRRVRRAVVRNGDLSIAASNTATPDRLWTVDTAEDGDWCVDDLNSVQLWRADASDAAGLVLTSDSGADAKAQWGKGEKILPWPAGTPAVDGEYYTIRLGDGVSRSVTLHLIQNRNDLLGLGQELKANHCDIQLDILAGEFSGA